MAVSISDVQQDLQGVIHGTTLNKVQNLFGLFNRAARKVLSDIDPQETRRIVEITSPIFDKVYDYPLPSDLKGNRIVDIRPQINRSPKDNFHQVNVMEFEAWRETHKGTFNIKFDNYLKSIRIAINGQPAATVSTLDSITSNGTWAVGGDATTLTEDDINHVSGSASLKFNTTGATGTSYIENSTLAAVDLSTITTEGSVFLYVYLPSNPVITTSVSVRIGSSAADYYQKSVTLQQDGTAFQFGWNLLRFELSTATVVGSPDLTDVTYSRLTVVAPAGTAETAYRMDNLTAQQGAIYEMEFYSKFMFRDGVTGAFKETVTDDSDLVNLDTDSYNIFFNVLAEMTNQQIVGQPANFDIGYFAQQYKDDVSRYVHKYPSETLLPSFTYYRFKGPAKTSSRRRFIS